MTLANFHLTTGRDFLAGDLLSEEAGRPSLDWCPPQNRKTWCRRTCAKLSNQCLQLLLRIHLCHHRHADGRSGTQGVAQQVPELQQHAMGLSWIVQLGRLSRGALARTVLHPDIAHCTVATGPEASSVCGGLGATTVWIGREEKIGGNRR